MDIAGADGKLANRLKEAPERQSRWVYAGVDAKETVPSGYPAMPSSPLPVGQNVTSNYNGPFENNGPIGNDSSMQNMNQSRPKLQQNIPAESQQKPLMEYKRPQYTLPGVLHFLQHEWTRFELDRTQWEVERAELQARVAFLQGERKAQESLKVDLVRRIKMLELALRQERNKFSRYKSEMEGSAQPVVNEDLRRFEEFENDYPINDVGYGDYMRESPQGPQGISWKEGRHLLRQYLKEIGYTDTLINVRSARIRALLGANSGRGILETERAGGNNNMQSNAELPKEVPKSVMDNALLAAENAICATFDFLNPDGAQRNEGEDSDEDEEEDSGSPFTSVFQRGKKSRKTIIPARPSKSTSNEDMAHVIGDSDTEMALKEFDFLGGNDGGGEARMMEEGWPSQTGNLARMKEEFRNEQKDRRGMNRPKRTHLQEMLQTLKQEDEITDLTSPKYPSTFTALPQIPFPTGDGGATDASSFALGELAALTVNNDAETGNYDLPTTRDGGLRKSWSTKYSLRSHFDGVRSLAFHPEELMLMTASDDGTLKYWNLFRNWNGNKKASSVDFEPVYTFRGHVGSVLSATMNHNGEYCISGGADSTIRFWNLSYTTGDPYEAYDPAIVGPILKQHTDAVWHLAHHATQPFMVSCGADERLIWWNTEKYSMLSQIAIPDWGAPSSADVFVSDTVKVSASFAHHAALFDIETGKSVVKFKIPENPDDYIYRIVNHPSLPIAITAHEDREVRFWDTNTGELINSMVAHLDAVSSIAVDPNGLYLVTGSHDSSVRFWSMDSKTCIQENTAHRKKLDESIYDVAFHACKSYVASAGADGVAKVYT